MKRSRNTAIALSIVVLAALLLPAAAFAAPAAPAMATYSITVENLTGTQPFSPPLFVAHGPGYNLFRLGAFASEGIQLIAETGNNATATAEAQASPFTADVVAQAALVFPGTSTTAELTAPLGARLSIAAMLGITNDGFTGVDGYRLPSSGSVTFEVGSFDAGTEMNNEAVGYVGALGGGNMRAPTHMPIASHAGILGVGDMDPAQYGWTDPVARVTVTRIK